MKFLGNDIFESTEIVGHLILASSDTRFSVATPALNELNKICTTLDWFDPKMPTPLYTLFLGNGSKVPDRKTSAASPRVKLKILQHLLKCRGNAINVAKGVQVIFEGLFGESTNQKCKVAALQFATNLISNGQQDLIEKLSKVFQTSITKLIGIESQEPVEVQNAAFQALAKLIVVCPETFNKDVKFIVDYFNYLNTSPPELQNSIRECMVALAQAFKWDPTKQKEEPMELDDDGKVEKKKFNERFTPSSNHLLILGVLSDNCESNLPVTKNIASLFLTTCFPSYFVPARYLLLVLCGTCVQLRETIYGYLYGSQRKDHINYNKLISSDNVGEDGDEKELLNDQMIILPPIKQLIHHVDQIAEKKLLGGAERSGGHKIAFNLDVFTEILDYMHLCLWYSAGCSSEPGNENEMHILSEYITNLDRSGNIEHIEKFTKLLRNIIVVKKGLVELSCLSDLLTAAPLIVTRYNMDLRAILAYSLREVNEPVRILIGKIYGVLVAYGTEDFNTEIQNLLNTSQKSLEYQHGSIVALSNALFYRILYFRQSGDDIAFAQLLTSKELSDSIAYLINLLTDSKSLLVLAAIKGLSLIGCSIELPLEEVSEQDDESMDVDVNKSSKNYIFKILLQLLKSSQTKQKIREDSAHCLGHLSIGDAKFFARR